MEYSKRLIILLIGIISMITLTFGQVPTYGSCPDVKVQTDFDAVKYMGLWYENQKYPVIFELGGKCVQAKYTLQDDGVVAVHNSLINSITNEVTDIMGTATVVEPGKLIVKFPSVPFEPKTPNYLVLSTDYETYSVVYSCTEFTKLFNAKIAWILTRERNPPAEVIEKALKVFEDNDITTSLLVKTDQENCP